MNSTGRWLARIGSLVIVLGFFLPVMAVSCTVSSSMGTDLGLPELPNISGQLLSFSLNELAGIPFVQGAILLYLIPLGVLAVLILTFLTAVDRNQEQGYLIGQIVGVGIGALAVIVAVLSTYSQVKRIPLFTVQPDVGLFVLILGYGLVAAGIVMQYSERGAYEIPAPGPGPRPRPRPRPEPLAPATQMVPAWLITGDGREHQLRQGLSCIGRSSRNDIVLSKDDTMSREHAKIIEEQGHYRLIDLGGPGGTRINGHKVRGQVILQSDDEIQFGQDTVVRFVTARR